jgi:heat shock protein HtpX
MGKNVVKLAVFLTALSVLFVLLGRAVGGTGGMVLATAFAVAMNLGAWWFSDRLVLRMAGARELAPGELPWLAEMTRSLAVRGGLPEPRLYVIEDEAPNAFATGRDPSRGVVAVTTGLTRLLTRDELAGVIAHELAHIKHRDTLLSAVVATIAGAVTMLANLGQWALIFGGLGGSDEEDGGGAAGLVMLFVAPIAATLIQLGISRAREFEADRAGAEIAGDPLALAGALEKIEWAAARQPALETSPATASLYIINPFAGGGLARLFSTHPPTAERIARLRALARADLGFVPA